MNTFTLVHILISLAGIVSGFIVVGGWIAGRRFCGWTTFFLAMTALTSITGFFFPIHGMTPGLVLGGLSLIVLAVAGIALKAKKRTLFTITALTALYFNFFVLIAQTFQHTPALQVLAPNQSGPAFGVSQGLVLVLFIFLGFAAVRGLRVSPVSSGN